MISNYLKRSFVISASALSAVALLAAAPLSASAQMSEDVTIEEDTEVIENNITDADAEMMESTESDMMESTESDMMESTESDMVMEESEMTETTATYESDVESDYDYSNADSEAVYSSTSPRALW